MTLIEKVEKVKQQAISLRLPVPTVELLGEYCEYLGGSDRAYVVDRALWYVFEHDEEFAQKHGLAPTRRRRVRMNDDAPGPES